MTSQDDFGKATDRELPIGGELIPGGLRGFRMFRVSAATGRLKSMIRSMAWPPADLWRTTIPVAKCHVAVAHVIGDDCSCAHEQLNGKGYIDCAGQVGWLRYICRCQTVATPSIEMWNFEDDVVVPIKIYTPEAYAIKVATVRFDPSSHSAPQKDCTCGFYASYIPETLIGSPGCNVYSRERYVLGVVEASGRVILGTRGFRAEKMRIVDTSPVDVITSPFSGISHPSFNQSFLDRYPPDVVSELLLKEEPKESKEDKVWQLRNYSPSLKRSP